MDRLSIAQQLYDSLQPDGFVPANGVYEWDAKWRGLPVIVRAVVRNDRATEIVALLLDGWSFTQQQYEYVDVGAHLQDDEQLILLSDFNVSRASYVKGNDDE